MELIATCAFGLEKLVHNEIKNLGLWTLKTEDGRVTFKGDESAIVRTNLWLRCADRIEIKMGEFQSTTFDELFDNVNAIEWEKYIDQNDVFPIKATSVKSILHSVPAIQSIVKKAIVKRLQKTYNMEILPENSNAIYQVVVKTNKDQFIICIDSSGDSLHKRGYRTKAMLAPIKETLAAAMVTLSDWKPERTLIDPFCGSGTIAIEAAMIGQNIAPGLKRQFAFQQWPWINKEITKTIREEAKAAAKPRDLSIYCFDIDPEALSIAEKNTKNAEITGISYKRADFNDLDFGKFENCTFITNPPYGERLQEEADVNIMYREFGQKFKDTKGCSLFLIAANENFPRLFGLPENKNRKLFNGQIRCYLFSFFAK
jgi:putative N6-adenine-specific DNA methylase